MQLALGSQAAGDLLFGLLWAGKTYLGILHTFSPETAKKDFPNPNTGRTKQQQNLNPFRKHEHNQTLKQSCTISALFYMILLYILHETLK